MANDTFSLQCLFTITSRSHKLCCAPARQKIHKYIMISSSWSRRIAKNEESQRRTDEWITLYIYVRLSVRTRSLVYLKSYSLMWSIKYSNMPFKNINTKCCFVFMFPSSINNSYNRTDDRYANYATRHEDNDNTIDRPENWIEKVYNRPKRKGEAKRKIVCTRCILGNLKLHCDRTLEPHCISICDSE